MNDTNAHGHTETTAHKKLYVLAELDNNVQLELRHYQNIIVDNGLVGEHTKDIPYHITLCSYSVDKEDYLVNVLDAIRERFSAIHISFCSLGLFGLRVLYMNPDMNMKLIELYNYCKEHDSDSNDHFTPHVTLLIDTPDNIINILPTIAERFKPTSGTIKYISVYEFFPKRFIKRIELC